MSNWISIEKLNKSHWRATYKWAVIDVVEHHGRYYYKTFINGHYEPKIGLLRSKEKALEAAKRFVDSSDRIESITFEMVKIARQLVGLDPNYSNNGSTN